ncbi:MAG: hypothetical protein Q7T11_09445 [Deltaproteobacteria bacterium]|nr:hypothetical protein [Deltaproteobacteria bacterium]
MSTINVYRLASMTPEEQEAYINEYMASEMADITDPAEIEAQITQLKETAALKFQERMDRYAKQIENLEDAQAKAPTDQLAEIMALLDSLNNQMIELEEASENFSDDVDDWAKEQGFKEQTLSAIGPSNFPSDFEDGAEFTIHIGSDENAVISNPFLTTSESDETEAPATSVAGLSPDYVRYLQELVPPQLDAEGNLMPDVTFQHINSDPVREAYLLTKRVVSFSLPVGIQVTGMIYNGEGNTVLTCTNAAEGKSFKLIFEGNAIVQINNPEATFAPGFFGENADSWPSPVQNRFYIGNKSVHEWFAQAGGADALDEQIRSMVSGYEDGLTGYQDVTDYTDVDTLSVDEQAQYEEVWNKLSLAVAQGTDVADVWNDLSLSPNVLKALIFSVAQNNPESFQDFFKGQTARLSNILVTADSDISEDSTRLALLVLEYGTGVPTGVYKLEELFAHEVEGEWKAGTWSSAEIEYDAEGVITSTADEIAVIEAANIAFLQRFQALAESLPDVFLNQITTAIANERALKTAVLKKIDDKIEADVEAEAAENADHAPGVASAKEEFLAIKALGAAGGLIPTVTDLESDDETAAEVAAMLTLFEKAIFDDDGNLVDNPAEALAKAILDNELWKADDDTDDLVALVVSLMDRAPFSQQFKDKFFGSLANDKTDWPEHDDMTLVDWLYEEDNPEFVENVELILSAY